MPGSLLLWGLLALLQIVYLPGHLCIRALRLRTGVVESLLLAFAFSSIANHFLVQIFVFCHCFTRPVMLGVVALEVLFVLRLWHLDAGHDRWQSSKEAYQGALDAWSRLSRPAHAVVVAVAVLGLYCIFSFAHFATSAWQDEGFNLWDNVMSWNRWATEWAANRFPWKTYHYPQLLPANSSIIYVLAKTTAVQSFNRLYFAFFPIATLVCLFDLGVRQRQIGYWLGIPFIYFAWIYMARPFPAEGYADVPVSFMMLMALYATFLAGEQRDAGGLVRWMLTAGLLAGGALLTKQTGFILLATLPVFLALLADRHGVLASPQKRRVIFWACGLAIATSVPWYLLKEVQIRLGQDQSEIAASVVAHGGRSLVDRILYGVQQMELAWGPLQTATIAVLALAAAFLRTGWAWVVRLIVIPGVLIWAVTTSYDLRNSNFVVVLGCASAGVTLGHLLSWCAAGWHRWTLALRCVLTAAIVVAVAFLLSHLSSVSDIQLISRSDKVQRTTAMPDLNEEIYRLMAAGRITKPVVTNYWMMHFIPGMKDYMSYNSLTEIDSFDEAMTRVKPQFVVILHPIQNYPAVSHDRIADRVAKGYWSVEKNGGSYELIEVHATPIPVETRAPAPPVNSDFQNYEVIDGLAPEEGPFPQWNLPKVVRWGLAPSTILEFDAKQNEVFELTFEIERPVMKLTMDIVFNGAHLEQLEIESQPDVQKLQYTLTARRGKNRVEIHYSAWDTKSESRLLAVLYRSLRIAPKGK